MAGKNFEDLTGAESELIHRFVSNNGDCDGKEGLIVNRGGVNRISMTTRLILLSVLAALGVGCTTIYSEGPVDEEAAQEQLVIQNLQKQVSRLQEKVNEMDAQRQDLYQRMEVLEGNLQTARQEQQERVAAMERGLSSVEASRQRDRDDVINKVTDLVKTTSSSRARTADGYEHVVQAGETLSAIAAAYNVKSSAIIEANSLKNPNSLRAGQKLFIPE